MIKIKGIKKEEGEVLYDKDGIKLSVSTGKKHQKIFINREAPWRTHAFRTSAHATEITYIDEQRLLEELKKRHGRTEISRTARSSSKRQIENTLHAPVIRAEKNR